jgi:hypothetical protein
MSLIQKFRIYTVKDKRKGYNVYDNFYPSEITPVNIYNSSGPDSEYEPGNDIFDDIESAAEWIDEYGSTTANYIILPIYTVERYD